LVCTHGFEVNKTGKLGIGKFSREVLTLKDSIPSELNDENFKLARLSNQIRHGF
jgi:hypothetical protein